MFKITIYLTAKVESSVDDGNRTWSELLRSDIAVDYAGYWIITNESAR